MNRVTIIVLSTLAIAGASASQTKYITTFQPKGAAAVEGQITYEPMENGKRTKSSAIKTFVGRPAEVVSTLDQAWQSEAELSAANLERCAALGGSIENVTVKAGTFRACKTSSVTAEAEVTKWTGAVAPNGLIRVDVKKKDAQTREELTEYSL